MSDQRHAKISCGRAIYVGGLLDRGCIKDTPGDSCAAGSGQAISVIVSNVTPTRRAWAARWFVTIMAICNLIGSV